MIDKERLHNVIASYKNHFLGAHWENEKYKWQAVKHFQEKFDGNTDNFSAMLQDALKNTGKLLAQKDDETLTYFYPRSVITKLSYKFPKEIKKLFTDLYDEKKILFNRYNNFKDEIKKLQERWNNKFQWKLKYTYHFTYTISVYLWLRFPEKYFIYQLTCVDALSKILKSSYTFSISNKFENNLLKAHMLFNEIRTALLQETDFLAFLHEQLDETCYADSQLTTLISDLAYYVKSPLYAKDYDYEIEPFQPYTNVLKYRENVRQQVLEKKAEKQKKQPESVQSAKEHTILAPLEKVPKERKEEKEGQERQKRYNKVGNE